MKLGAVIVAYNSGSVLGRCLDSCLRHKNELEAGIVVVDNASSDATREEVRARPDIRLLENHRNLGFAGAVNQGFQYLQDADAILILNPDVEMEASPSILAAALEDPATGAAAGAMLAPDGRPQTGFMVRRFPTPLALVFEVAGLNRMWPSNRVNRRYRALDFDYTAPAWVEQPAGGCLLVRHAGWSATGGFDEGFYPIWFEDVDFLKRLTDGGWRVRYLPEFRVFHSGGHSIRSLPWGLRQLYWYGSLLRYAARHFRRPGRWVVCGAVVAGMLPRTVMGIWLERSFQPLAICGKVVQLAVSYLVKGSFDTSIRRASLRAADEESPRQVFRD